MGWPSGPATRCRTPGASTAYLSKRRIDPSAQLVPRIDIRPGKKSKTWPSVQELSLDALNVWNGQLIALPVLLDLFLLL
jgi:hypothetical protein